MKKYKFLLTTLIIFYALAIFSLSAKAEDTTVTGAMTAQAVAESANLANGAESLEGVKITEPTKIPSGFGFWWNDLVENISLALTFNPVKKAEKQLQFAAQRVKLAEYMAQNSADAKVQEKARQLLARADQYMGKIQDKKNELIKNINQKEVQVLLSNTAKQEINTQLALEKLEDKLPPEKLEAFQKTRSQIEARQQKFLENLKDSPEMPKIIKDHAVEIKTRVESTIQSRKEFRDQQKEILDEIKAGKDEARSALEQIKIDRNQAIQQAQEQYREEKTKIIDKINSGDKEATKELIQLNQNRKNEIKEIQQELKIKATEIKTELKNTIKESSQELKQNIIEQKNKE